MPPLPFFPHSFLQDWSCSIARREKTFFMSIRESAILHIYRDVLGAVCNREGDKLAVYSYMAVAPHCAKGYEPTWTISCLQMSAQCLRMLQSQASSTCGFPFFDIVT